MGWEELQGCFVRPDLLSRGGMDTLIRSLPQGATTDGLGLNQGWALPWEGVAPGRGDHIWPS